MQRGAKTNLNVTPQIVWVCNVHCLLLGVMLIREAALLLGVTVPVLCLQIFPSRALGRCEPTRAVGGAKGHGDDTPKMQASGRPESPILAPSAGVVNFSPLSHSGLTSVRLLQQKLAP